MADLQKIVDDLSNLTVLEAANLAEMLKEKWSGDRPCSAPSDDGLAVPQKKAVRNAKMIPKAGKCVHCLRDPVKLTSDHMFPKAWYPDTTPDNLEKWQIPSCRDCNSRYSKIEGDLRNRVALALDSTHPAFAGLIDAALRALDPGAGRDERDAAARTAYAKTILSELYKGEEISEDAIMPGLGERWGRPKAEQLGVKIPRTQFVDVAEKIVRGLVYREDGGFIEAPYKIDTYVVTDGGAKVAKQMLDKAGKVFARGPGIEVRRAAVDGDECAGLYEITFWQQFKVYATVSKGEIPVARKD